MNIKAWISALRPRTLFLAIATTLCASGMAYSYGVFSWSVCILTIITATLLQLLSNMANDLGDFQHGTDTTGNRVGPQRTVQGGKITPQQMIKGIWVAIILTAFVGLALIYEALQFMEISHLLIFLVLGIASIIAAVKYTAGDNPYGYKGLGDIFSFIFFGLVSIVGTYFLHTHTLNFQPWLPAIGMGLFTAAVLNINNMRDLENDKISGKITIPVRLGIKGAKLYHAILTFGGIICFLAYSMLYATSWIQYLYVIILLIFIKLLIDIYRIKDDYLLDPYLKYTSMSTFLLSVAFVICINI